MNTSLMNGGYFIDLKALLLNNGNGKVVRVHGRSTKFNKIQEPQVEYVWRPKLTDLLFGLQLGYKKVLLCL